MCLTLANAATIHHHTDPTGTAVRGYTSTSHRAALRSTSPDHRSPRPTTTTRRRRRRLRESPDTPTTRPVRAGGAHSH